MHVVGKTTDVGKPGSDSDRREMTEQNLRILIAEDDPINQKVIVGLLGLIPCQCDVVENGAEAVAALMRSPYDIVLMDAHMPVMDGITATQEIRSLDGAAGQTPVIAVTADAMQGDRERYLAAGMDDYVAKPIDSKRLLAAIGRCTGRTFVDQEMQTPGVVV